MTAAVTAVVCVSQGVSVVPWCRRPPGGPGDPSGAGPGVPRADERVDMDAPMFVVYSGERFAFYLGIVTVGVSAGHMV